jgi:phosphonate transport system substrate-binding protein
MMPSARHVIGLARLAARSVFQGKAIRFLPRPDRRLLPACVLTLTTLLLAPPALAQEPRTYYFSPVNQYGIELTARYWNPLIRYVSERAGVRLQLKLGRTSADTTAYVLAHEVDFVFTNHLFSPERDRLGWKTFGRRNTPLIHSQIVVLADSPVRTLEQLSGQTVAFPGPEALVAYKFSYAELIHRSVPVQVVFSGNMDGAFAQLSSGRAQAAGSNSQLTDGWARREGKALRVLWQSQPLHDLALMVSKHVPQADLRAVERAFLDMARDPEGRRLLASAAELVKLPPDTSFVASDGSEYGAYRSFYQNAPASLR